MFLMLDDKPFDRFQLMYRIAEVRSNRDRFQPKFRGAILAVDMHVRRLTGFMAVKVHPIRAVPQNRRHEVSLTWSNFDSDEERKSYC